MKKLVKGHGGMVAYLGTHDMQKVEKQIQEGNNKAKLVYEAMAYQISKEICALSAILTGNVDAIALTGGLANSKSFVDLITRRIEFLAPVFVFPGEQEMRALAMGAFRVLSGEEDAKIYELI